MTSSKVEFRVSTGQKEQMQWDIRRKCEGTNTIDLFPTIYYCRLEFLTLYYRKYLLLLMLAITYGINDPII